MNLKHRNPKANLLISKKIGVVSINFFPKSNESVYNSYNSVIPFFKWINEAFEKDFSPNFKSKHYNVLFQLGRVSERYLIPWLPRLSNGNLSFIVYKEENYAEFKEPKIYFKFPSFITVDFILKVKCKILGKFSNYSFSF